MAYSPLLNIDLHIHSSASDGTLSPREIVDLAGRLSLGAISITDHDTVEGAREASTVPRSPSLHFLTGVEISASPIPSLMVPGSFHILGYDIDVDNPALNAALQVLRRARRERNPMIVSRLNALGFNLTMAEISENSSDSGQIGRPHIAKMMVKKGYVPSIDAAFDRYLATDQSAYVDKYRMDCETALSVIRNAGGMPVLAHPVLLRLKRSACLNDLITVLKAMGLAGIEAYYPDHSCPLTARYIEMADRHDLLVTGGTDFHGSLKPDTQIGSGEGGFRVPYALYDRVIRRASK